MTATGENGAKVLIADDDADSAEALAMLLSLDGYQTFTCRNASEAMARAHEQRPTFVLLDLRLGLEDGCVVARKLRAEAAREELCLIAMTGFSDPGHRRAALDAGFDSFLVKPIEIEDLRKVLLTHRRVSSQRP